MKPFNLERALAGDPVVTRGGVPVPRLEYFPEVEEAYKIAVVLNGKILTCTEKGKFALFGDTQFDLFMAPKKVKGYVVIFPTSIGPYSFSRVFDTAEIAKREMAYKGVEDAQIIEVEYEE